MQMKAKQIALVILSAIAVFLYWQKYQDTYKDEGRLLVSQEGDAVKLVWKTSIELPMARRFEEAYREWRDKTRKFIIILDSNGGALREGRFVIDVIEKMKQTHFVETRVEAGADCLSMCVPIYLRGDKRTAASNSRWMFHEPTSYDFVTGEKADRDDDDRREAGERFFQKYFVNSEMNPDWRSKLQEAWVGRDVWFSGQQLVNQNSNVITHLK